MKNNWLITQTVIGLVVSSLFARAAELAQPVPAPALDELGYPTNELIALELGRADGTRDVNNGVLRLPMYGSPSEWSSDFTRILEEKYKIQRLGLGGPLISQSLIEYARGYGEISDHAIKDKFGGNFFERVQVEAKQAHDQRMQAAAAAPAAAPVVVVATPPASTPAITTPVDPTPVVTTAVAASPTVPTAVATTPVVVTPVVTAPAVTAAVPPEVATPAVATPTVTAQTITTPVVVPQNLAPPTRTYRVKPGDTFWEIARQHRVPVSSLVAANPGVNPGKLQINYNLNVPTATRP